MTSNSQGAAYVAEMLQQPGAGSPPTLAHLKVVDIEGSREALPQEHLVCADGLRDPAVAVNVREVELAPLLQHPVRLPQHARLVGGQVDHAVGDDDVHTAIRDTRLPGNIQLNLGARASTNSSTAGRKATPYFIKVSRNVPPARHEGTPGRSSRTVGAPSPCVGLSLLLTSFRFSMVPFLKLRLGWLYPSRCVYSSTYLRDTASWASVMSTWTCTPDLGWQPEPSRKPLVTPNASSSSQPKLPGSTFPKLVKPDTYALVLFSAAASTD
jgi:hypothetical protein